MHRLRIRFFHDGSWTDDPKRPPFKVRKGEERDVERHFGLYMVKVGRGEIVYDHRDDFVIPDAPTLSDLDLHRVTAKTLEIHGITTLEQLTALTQIEVLDIKGIGMAKLNEIEEALALLNLHLEGKQ